MKIFGVLKNVKSFAKKKKEFSNLKMKGDEKKRKMTKVLPHYCKFIGLIIIVLLFVAGIVKLTTLYDFGFIAQKYHKGIFEVGLIAGLCILLSLKIV